MDGTGSYCDTEVINTGQFNTQEGILSTATGKSVSFFLAGAKHNGCMTSGLTLSFMDGNEQVSSKEVDTFYSANQEEYHIPLPDLFERSSGALQVTYKAYVAGGTLSKQTRLTLKCVGPIAEVTPVSPAQNSFVFDEGKTPLEFQVGSGCQADSIVLTVNGNRAVVPSTGGTLVTRHDTAVTWRAHMEDVVGTPGEASEPETFYMCPRMSFVSHGNQSVAVRVEEERVTEVELAWPKFEWADAPVCGQAADTLNAVKYRLTVKDETGAESVSTVSERNATLMLLPGTYEVKFEVVVGGTALKHSEKWSVRVYTPTPPTPEEDSDKGGLSKGAVAGIAVGCSVVGAALIVGLVLLIIFSVRRYGKKKADEAVAQSQASLQTTMGQPAGSVFLVDPSMVMMDQMGGVPVMLDPTIAVPAPPTPNGSQEMSQSSFQQSQQSQQQQASTMSLKQQQQMAMMMMMMSQQQQQSQSAFPMTDASMVSPPQ